MDPVASRPLPNQIIINQALFLLFPRNATLFSTLPLPSPCGFRWRDGFTFVRMRCPNYSCWETSTQRCARSHPWITPNFLLTLHALF